ncbi:RagB/SusD family nutrient uptake outer membrane protein [Parapedobacter defluvii]|uniref:RagB/SusD family nutrient uptake outer membrane protein n=1 Tax=Parapedobacter defluvii TaxID=2045106 RepID=UPI0033411E38
MNMKTVIPYLIACSLSLFACNKSEFLDKKPAANILIPNTLEDLRGLLENKGIFNNTPGLPQISADEYFIVDDAAFSALIDPVTRNAYTWAADIYEGATNIPDWNVPYTQIFYANSVLDILEKSDFHDREEAGFIKGWALFARGYAYYNLVQNFGALFDPSNPMALGVPLRLSPDVDRIAPRATVSENYQQIFKDLAQAASLLAGPPEHLHRNRPSKAAAYALLSRIYLSLNDFGNAEKYADSTLMLYSTLIDYNTVDVAAATPFSNNTLEVIYFSTQSGSYPETSGYNLRPAIGVDPDLINKYDVNDLRLQIYFLKNTLGNYNVKRGYIGVAVYPSTGLATDEIYLIKAECQARRGDNDGALRTMDTLLEKRYKTGEYVPLKFESAAATLDRILWERRKELVWRGLRWTDIKRLNAIGANITLIRNIGGKEYTLAPGSPRYVFPIPDDEIVLSKIQQNDR